jgi:hypothetical protein
MSATTLNTSPIYSGTPNVAWGTVATANTAKDGTGTVVTVFTAGADGGRCDYVRARALGTNIATVLRVFINNGSSNAVAANNTLFTEITVAATTLSEVAAQVENTINLGLALDPGYKVNITIGTTIAAGLAVTGVGGDY